MDPNTKSASIKSENASKPPSVKSDKPLTSAQASKKSVKLEKPEIAASMIVHAESSKFSKLTESLAESKRRLAVPLEKVHVVHQSYKKLDAGSAIPIHENLRKLKEQDLIEKAASEHRTVEELREESLPSREIRLNEFGYYEPAVDIIAELMLSNKRPETESMQVSAVSRITTKSEAKRRTKTRKKTPKAVVRRMYHNGFTDIMQSMIRRNKAEIVSRLWKILKLDLKTGRQIPRSECEKSKALKQAKTKSARDRGGDSNKIGLVSGAVVPTKIHRSKAKLDLSLSKTVASPPPEVMGSKAEAKGLVPYPTKKNNAKPIPKNMQLEKDVGMKWHRSKAANVSDSAKTSLRSTSELTALTPSEMKKKLRTKRRQKTRKDARQLLEEILATSIFSELRGSEEKIVEELYRAEEFKAEDEDEILELELISAGLFGNPEESEGIESLRKHSKQEKKFFRKEGILLDQVARQLGIPRSRHPNTWIVVWGAGLMLGTLKSQLAELFYPRAEEIRFYLDKPYCTLKFSNSEDAAKARVEFTGRRPFTDQVLYIGYLSKEPPAEDPQLLLPFITPPRGLTVLEQFISEEDESKLLEQILSLRLADTGKDLKHRWVRHFGYEFNYDTNNVDENSPMSEPIPAYLDNIIRSMIERGVLQRKPEQLTINAYKPGQGIPPHVDTHSAFESPIVSLSLWSDIVMDFRRGNEQKAVKLPRRSLLVLNEMSRLAWKHGIASRTIDIVPDETNGGVTSFIRKERISLTFRLLRNPKECFCMYPEMCDTQKGKITEELAPKLEQQLVHDVYDEIATHFSCTRHTPWPKVKEFVQSLSPGSTLLDVGCGNGKYFNLAEYVYQVGTDMSKGLLEIARNKTNVDAVQSHCMHLPFKDNSFDAVICIAVLHHLCTEARRTEALSEILRIMSPGAEALIYVWAKDQRVNEMKSAYARQRERKTELFNISPKCELAKDYSFLPIHDHEADFAQADMLVPWIKVKPGVGSKEDADVHHRFYHVFEKGELEELLKKLCPRPRIVDVYYDQGNWCVRFQKEGPAPKALDS